jgi:hypothetical protein
MVDNMTLANGSLVPLRILEEGRNKCPEPKQGEADEREEHGASP